MSSFFFNDTATTEIYTLSLHDALPIYVVQEAFISAFRSLSAFEENSTLKTWLRSEEHTSELQSRQYLVCRLLLEKKNSKQCNSTHRYIVQAHVHTSYIHSCCKWRSHTT